MRLTLRTLLAYMDDILDPADHEELARKIEASPFATELIHRSRDAIRRLRLSAPEVLAGDEGDLHGGQSNMDANTAAEYLDSLLSPEEIADFERSCLEAGPHADMLLAEAVSCHHILTLVLGEPAEVDADLRQRMYALADEPAPAEAVQTLRIEPGHTPKPLDADAAPVAAARRGRVEPDESAVPDYILEAARSRRQRQRLWTSVAAMAVFGGLATWLLWPQGEVELPREMAKSGVGDVDSLSKGEGFEIGDSANDAATSEGADGAPDDDSAVAAGDDSAASDAPPFNAAPAESEAPAFVAPTPGESTVAAAPAVEATEGPAAETAVDGPAIGDAAGSAVDTTIEPAGASESTTADAGDAPVLPPVAGETAATEDPGAGAPPPIPTPPTETTASVTPPQTPPQLPPQTPEEGTPGEAMLGDVAAADEGTPPPAPAATAVADKPVVAEGPKTIGSYLGINDLLMLRYDPSIEAWIRLAPRSALASGDRLLALPNFRTHAVLADANVYLGGGTEIDLTAPVNDGSGEAPADINIAMPFGRVIINSGLNGNRLRLTLGNQTRDLALGSSSSLAVEARRLFVPGADPERDPAPMEVSWYLTSGTATPAGALEGSEIEGPAAWTTIDGEDQAAQAISELPEWIDREPLSDSQRRALEPVAAALAPGSPVNLRLAELSDPSNLGRRIEVRSLAAEAGAYVGQFDPLVKTLSDVNQKASWKARILALREAIARDGAAAVAGIREAFAVQRGEAEADDLMEMLIGFDAKAVGTTRAEVQNGALVRLVRWLESDDLTHRVLALHNINEITGTVSLGGFKPEHSAEQRRREIQYYWTRLEKGELMPKE